MSALGYVPNLVAGGLRSARSHVVTALVPTLTGPLFGEMVQALTDALELRGFQVMVGQVGYARSREDALLRAIVGRRPDGIVLTGVMHSPEGRRLLMASGISVVETWDFTDTPSTCSSACAMKCSAPPCASTCSPGDGDGWRC